MTLKPLTIGCEERKDAQQVDEARLRVVSALKNMGHKLHAEGLPADDANVISGLLDWAAERIAEGWDFPMTEEKTPANKKLERNLW